MNRKQIDSGSAYRVETASGRSKIVIKLSKLNYYDARNLPVLLWPSDSVKNFIKGQWSMPERKKWTT